jgi:uncharacterized membrane protein YjjB (DUF3815 family)
MDKLLQILMGTIGTLGFSVVFNLRGKKLLLATLGGTLSWTICLLLEGAVSSEPARYFFSAMFVAAYAEVLARIMKTPTTTFLISGIIPHIPGGSLYYTMRFALNRQWTECLSRAFYTLKLAMSLALGMIVVLSLLNVINKILIHALYAKRKEPVR